VSIAALNGWLIANRFLIIFALLASLMGTSVGVARITTTFFAIDLGADARQIGLLTAGQMAGTLVVSVPIGFLVDHVGPWRLYVAGSSLAGLTYAFIPAVDSTGFLLGATTAISFFMPLRFVSLNTVFFDQIRKMGPGKAGWYRAMHMSGQFLIGPAVAVSLVSLLGYAGAWWALAASFALTIAISPLAFAGYSPKPRADAPRPDLRRVAVEFALLARHRELRGVCIVNVCVEAVLAYHTTFIVAIALQVFGLGAADASAFVTGTGLAFIATLLLMGGPIGRLGARRSFLAGFALVTVALIVLGAAGGPAGLWPGIVMLGIGVGMAQTVTLALTAEIGGELGQGKVSGLILVTMPAGAMLGGFAGGWAAQHLGLQAVYGLFVPVFLALFAWQWRRPAAQRSRG
jgi:MFS family permease